VPYLKLDELKGYAITRQGLRVYRDELSAVKTRVGRPYIGLEAMHPAVSRHNTDIGEIKKGYVSVTPLSLISPHIQRCMRLRNGVSGLGSKARCENNRKVLVKSIIRS